MKNVKPAFISDNYKQKVLFIIVAVIGVALTGFGIAFNSAAALGNDAVAILYDGIRTACGLSIDKLGVVTNIVNVTVFIIVLILSRKYINIGTFIYILPMGLFVSVGSKIYAAVIPSDTIPCRIVGAVLGCMMLFIGIGTFIAADIGFDPFTGVVMIIKDKIKSQYRTAKIMSDVISITVGFLLGGMAGPVTVVAAFAGGPVIQKSSEVVKSIINKLMRTDSVRN